MSVLVLIPTYNERTNLPVLVERIMRHQGYEVLVLDDASPDGTGAVADELTRRYPGRVAVVHRTGKRGLGRSYIEGLTRARQGCSEFVCQMDADLSHDPGALPQLVGAASAGADAFLVELLYGAHVAGLRIAEVPIVFVERREGESKLGSGVIVESMLMPFRVVARARRHQGRATALPSGK